MPNIFTYGTLEIPEVMEAVTGRSCASSVEAVANDFARYLLKDRMYPGMMPSIGETTTGRLYTDVDERTLKILDEFEDEVYRRQQITVECGQGEWREAFSYIVPLEHQAILSNQRWCREVFVANHLGRYISACQAFYDEVGSRLS